DTACDDCPIGARDFRGRVIGPFQNIVERIERLLGGNRVVLKWSCTFGGCDAVERHLASYERVSGRRLQDPRGREYVSSRRQVRRSAEGIYRRVVDFHCAIVI